MTHRLTALVLGILLSMPLIAQVPVVRVSPYAEVKQRIGLTDVSITYHRPGVKGRTIWGDLQKYGEIWRAGANEPTILTTTDSLTVSGKTLPPGSYRLAVIPAASGNWSFIFNSEVKNWGTVYDSTYDLLRLSIPPTAAPHEEWMSFSFEDLTATSAVLVLHWEKVALRVPLSVNTAGKFAALTRTANSTSMGTVMAHSRFLLENGGDLGQAEKLADQANAMQEGAGTLRLKAEILAKQGKFSDAIKSAEKAIQVGKAANPNFNATFLNSLITEWKEKGGKK
ncbi:MAG: DUF2911 domain-containing protein [Bacteroidetes bacterium]|jgi:hypothetical protein|nr:DUF2911 domain-containing protein [Bacteroidota bacterium]